MRWLSAREEFAGSRSAAGWALARAVLGQLEKFRGEVTLVGRGASLRDRAALARIMAGLHLRLGPARRLFLWLPRGDDAPMEIELACGKKLLARVSDAVTLYEQFGLDVYGMKLPNDAISTVVDLGANIGYATVALAGRYEHARFVCVEPDDESRALLERNLACNGVDAEIIGVAVVGEAGKYELKPWRFSAANRVERCADGDLEGVTLAEVLRRADVDFVDLLKVDIEGGEREIFLDAVSWADRVGTIVAELHDGIQPSDVAGWLAPYGFRRVSLPAGRRFLQLVCFSTECR